MLRLVPALSFSLLVVLPICSLATDVGSVSFPSGDLKSTSFNSMHADFSSGFVTLNGSTGLSEILYIDPFDLIDPSSKAALSFNSFFTVSADSTSANGSFGFVIVHSSTPGDAYNGVNTFVVEFNNTCGSYNGYDSSAQYPDGYPGWYQRGPGGWGGFRGQNSLTNVVVSANGRAISPISSSVDDQWQGYGPQDPPSSPWPSSCVPPDSSSLYAYQLVVQYNASAKQVTIALGSACAFAGQVVYSQDLTSVFSTQPNMYAGFIASNGAVYNLSQWNFTTNATSTLLSTVAVGDTSGNPSTSGSSNSKISKGYVAGFTLLGGGIGVATLVGACFLYRKRRAHGVAASDAASFESKPAKGMVNKNAKPIYEYDTAPLNPMKSRSSSFFAGTPTWLKPVAPR